MCALMAPVLSLATILNDNDEHESLSNPALTTPSPSASQLADVPARHPSPRNHAPGAHPPPPLARSDQGGYQPTLVNRGSSQNPYNNNNEDNQKIDPQAGGPAGQEEAPRSVKTRQRTAMACNYCRRRKVSTKSQRLAWIYLLFMLPL